MKVINNNLSIFSAASILFILNQAFEFFLINVFESSYSNLCIWDCGWYSALIANGYDVEPYAHDKMDAANWAFFPFFPLVAMAISYFMDFSGVVSAILASKLIFLLSIYSFMKMVKAYAPDISFVLSGSVVAFSPYAIYGNVGYTESSFLLFSSWFFFYLKEERFLAAALVGAFLTSTRFVGIFVVASYFLYGVRRFKDKQFDIQIYILGMLIIPIGLALFMFYLYGLSGDALAFSNIQRAWGRSPGNPLSAIYGGFKGNIFAIYGAIISLLALLAVFYFVYKKMYEFSAFTLFATIIPLSTGLWAMPRYIFWQAPILFLLVYFSAKNKFLFMFFILPIFLIGQAIMYKGWLSGAGWTI